MADDHTCQIPGCGCGTSHGPTPPVVENPKPWRPAHQIRPIAIGIFQRDDQILAAPVYDDAGQIKGWRPLGGGLEFGEPAREALRREMREETRQEITDIRQIAVLENIFDHHGAQGHEVVFVLTARFVEPSVYAADQLAFEEDGQHGEAKWIALSKVRAGRTVLFPDGLADVLAELNA